METLIKNNDVINIDMSRWMTVVEYAKREGITIPSVLGRIRRGKLKSIIIVELNNLQLVER